MAMVCGIQSGNMKCAPLQSLQFPTENILVKKLRIKIPPKPIESKSKVGTSSDDTKLYSAGDSKVRSSTPGSNSKRRPPPRVVDSPKLKRRKMDSSVTQLCSAIIKEKPDKMTKIGCHHSLKKIIHKDVPLSPKAAIRVAKLKSRFAGTILKAQQETLLYHAGKADRLKMQQQMQRERDREAARLVLEKMEKAAEFEDNLQIGKYFESLNVFASIKPLEELGLVLKDDISIKPLEEFRLFL